MRCEKVLSHLSLFLDEMLEGKLAVEIPQHLRACSNCSREFARLKRLQDALRSVKPVATPDYLYDLVGLKISSSRRDSWAGSLRSALEYRWSKIRTTEGMWYVTRLMGTMATAVLFVAICAAMNPIYLDFSNPVTERGGVTQALRFQQLWMGVLKNLGLTPAEAQKRPISPSGPKINDLNFLNFAQGVSGTSHDYTVSVVTVVDRSGAAKVQNILEYPADESLLNGFTDMIMSANWRPASRNGRAVDSRLVLTFSKVCVYE